jgi:hypothetical protein
MNRDAANLEVRATVLLRGHHGPIAQSRHTSLGGMTLLIVYDSPGKQRWKGADGQAEFLPVEFGHFRHWLGVIP